jgi:hypothetical protein
MKTSQYVRQEKAIAAADRGGIRERWLWGLRLLRDPEAFAPGSSQLKPGRADELVKTATVSGLKLSEREIRRRLQCARTYPTEAEFGQALAEFGSWFDLAGANFPTYEAPEGEPPADHRTEAEREHDRARALLDLIGEQGSLFPLSQFEPVITPLKDLVDYADQMEDLTGRFVERDKKRRAYLNKLVEAADEDLSMTWQAAHDRLTATGEDVERDAAEDEVAA